MPPRAKVVLDPALATPAPGEPKQTAAQVVQMDQVGHGTQGAEAAQTQVTAVVEVTEVKGPIHDQAVVSASTV